MKRIILFLAVVILSVSSMAQTRYVYYVDSVGNNHISTTALPLVAIWGQFANILNKPTTLSGYGITDATPTSRTLTINGTTQDLSTNRSWTVSSVPYTAGTGISVSGNVITNTAPDQTVSITAGNGIVVTGTYPNFTISAVQPTIATPTRTVNTAFTISTTKSALVFYTITTSATNPLIAGSSTATATLQYSTNGGTSYVNATQLSNLSSVALAVTVQLTNSQTAVLSSIIPANALVKITTATTGTASVTINSAQEITY